MTTQPGRDNSMPGRTPRPAERAARSALPEGVRSCAEQGLARPPLARGAEASGTATGEWFVLHTKVNQEKALAEALAARRIAHFLPLVRQVRPAGARGGALELPLFPGYLFLRGSRDDAYAADRTKRVARIIPVVDQARIDWELRNIRLALEQQAPLDPYPYLKTGVRAAVRGGPLRGLEGIVESRVHCHRLILQVEMLGRAVAVEIDGSLLEPL